MSDNQVPMEIDVQTVASMLEKSEDFLLLDCREPQEHETARIDGAALIPMGQLMERVGELQPHSEKPLIVHCHLGGRSLRVAEWLRQNGYPQAQNMTGGIDAWSKSVDPSVPTY